jgi:hypothetical protein
MNTSQPIKCTSWLGHKFQGRYSRTETEGTVEGKGDANAMVRAINASKGRTSTYHCDVCVRCGLVINLQDD